MAFHWSTRGLSGCQCLQPKDFTDDAHELLSYDLTPGVSYGPLVEIMLDEDLEAAAEESHNSAEVSTTRNPVAVPPKGSQGEDCCTDEDQAKIEEVEIPIH